MKTLKESILKESILKESILTSIGQGDKYLETTAKENLYKYFHIEWERYDRDVLDFRDGGVFFRGKLELNAANDIEEIPVRFSEIRGEVVIKHCNNLKSLKGLSKILKGSIKIEDCPRLETLEGMPEEIWYDVEISNCRCLRSLEGLPKKKLKKLYVFECPIEDLEGAPWKVDSIRIGGCHELKSLQGFPKVVVEYIIIGGCERLQSLEGINRDMTIKEFSCTGCNIKNIEGIPKKILGSVYVDGCNKLESLKGAPDEVGGSFHCNNNPSLKTLDCENMNVKGRMFFRNTTNIEDFTHGPYQCEYFVFDRCQEKKVSDILSFKIHTNTKFKSSAWRTPSLWIY